jgi:hypothetical protein
MPLLVRPHLVPPARSTVEIGASNLDLVRAARGGGPMEAILSIPDAGAFRGAWVLSSQAVDASGDAVASIPLARTGACAPRKEGPTQRPPGAEPDDERLACFAEIRRLGYRQQLTYQPASRFWPFQWYETGIYAGLTLGLAWLCFWRLRRRLS